MCLGVSVKLEPSEVAVQPTIYVPSTEILARRTYVSAAAKPECADVTGTGTSGASADVTGGLEQNEKFVYEKKYRTVSMR